MITNFLLDAALALVAGDATLLDGASMGLFTNAPDVNDPDLALGDIVIPTFTGYAPVVLAEADWDPAVSESGVPYLVGDPAPFQPSNGTNLPEVINGCYYFNGTELLRVAYFPVPIPLVVALQMMHATPAFALGAGDPIPQEGSTS
jgi:hypothetical protein